ncbi:MAG: hypothetical protein L7U72_10840 [Rubripirellula sp.]|nr:hypothetical protein [Rubripirellula sp.]
MRNAFSALLFFLTSTGNSLHAQQADEGDRSASQSPIVSSGEVAELFAEQSLVSLADASSFDEALEVLGLDTELIFKHPLRGTELIESIPEPLPFWAALDRLLDQKQLDVDFYGGGSGTLNLVSRQPGRLSRSGAAAYCSVFRIEPISVTSKRTVRQAGLSGVSLAIEISWEPQVRPIGLAFPLQEIRAMLDDGSVLLPQQSGGTIEVSTNSEIAFAECRLPLQLPEGRPRRIESLKGVIQTMLPGIRQRFEIPLSGEFNSVTIDAMTVRVGDVRQQDQLQQVSLEVELEDAGRSLESHRRWVLENRAFLQKEDGTQLSHLGFEVLSQSDSGFRVNYLFNLSDGAHRATLIYESPTSVATREIEFEIKEIELP